jgi:very-short-patch-repair endonuclease
MSNSPFEGGQGDVKNMARRKIIPYDPNLKERARQLRNDSTLAEVLFWNRLKSRQMLGYQFLRQKPLDEYIVDFFCYDLMLAIEIDGYSHDYKIEPDHIRQQRLESFGIRFLRFTDHDVKTNMDGVLRTIEAWIIQHS